MLNKLLIIVGSLLVISIGFNVALLIGKGINIKNEYHQEQYQNQQQSQIMVGIFNTKGNLKWKLYSFDDIQKMSFSKGMKVDDAVNQFLITLSPEQSLYAKIYNTYVIVPELVEPDFKEKKK
jgi:hypothetical protein